MCVNVSWPVTLTFDLIKSAPPVTYTCPWTFSLNINCLRLYFFELETIRNRLKCTVMHDAVCCSETDKLNHFRTNRRAIAMMFVCLFVWDGMHCDHRVHFSADLSLWLDSSMFWAPWHQSMSTYSQPSFSSSTWKTGGIWMCKPSIISQEWLKIEVKLLLSAIMKS